MTARRAPLWSPADDTRLNPEDCDQKVDRTDDYGDPWSAVHSWIRGHLVEAFGQVEGVGVLDRIRFSSIRPPAHITLDDRGCRFEGQWPNLEELAAFKPWNKRPASGTAEGRAEIDDLIASTAAAMANKRAAPAVDLDLLREVARRSCAAGCGMIEYHEEDCQAEVAQIIDDVLKRKEAPAEYDAEVVRIAAEGIAVRVYPPAVAFD